MLSIMLSRAFDHICMEKARYTFLINYYYYQVKTLFCIILG